MHERPGEYGPADPVAPPWLGLVLFGIAASLLLSGLWFLANLEPARVRSVFKGEVDRIRLVVTNPSIAAFRATRMKGRAAGGAAACIEGLVTPVRGIEMIYRRAGKEPLTIAIGFGNGDDDVPVAFLANGAGDATPLNGPHTLTQADPSECPGDPTARLAVHGDVEFGQGLLPADVSRDFGVGLMSSGTINRFGQSLESAFGVHLGSSIYKIDELTLPAGSTLRAEREARASPFVWWGVAQIDPDKPGMTVEASTDAPRMTVAIPGEGQLSSTIRLGEFRQLTTDPNVLLVFGVISAVAGFLSSPLAPSFIGHSLKVWAYAGHLSGRTVGWISARRRGRSP